MTMRRAQGATLDSVALFFDRKLPDRGYSYVGASRVRNRGDLFHVGPIRRTDWLPVGGNPDEEQRFVSCLSETDSEDEMEDEMEDSSEEEEDDEDGGFLQGSDSSASEDDEAFGAFGNAMDDDEGCDLSNDMGGLF